DGVDRRSYVLVRAVDPDRVHDQLSGEPDHGAARSPGDRPDVLLRPAGYLSAHPDGGDDPDRRCGGSEAPPGPLLPRRGAPRAAAPTGRQVRVAGRPGPPCAGPGARLWPPPPRPRARAAPPP